MRAAAARGGGDGAAGQGTRRTPRMLGPRPAGCGADEGAKGAGLMVSEGHKKRHHRSLHLSSLGLVANDRTSRPRRADGGVGGGTRQRARGGSQGHRTDGQRTRQDKTRRGSVQSPSPRTPFPPPLVTLLGAAHPPQMVLESMTTSPGQQRGGNGLWWRQHAKAA